MPKPLKISALLLGTGLVIGAAAIIWVRTHPADETAVDSKGGSVAIDTRETPAPTADPLALHVAAANPDSAQGVAQTGAGTNGSAGGASSGGGTGSSTAPSSSDFKQYDQYKNATGALFGDIKAGTGEAVAAGKVVTVTYHGWLTDGTLFDETAGPNTYSFTEGEHRVIPGWEQGLMGMKAGGQRRLIVPPAVGYGAEAHGPIPGGSVLVFDVELISVK